MGDKRSPLSGEIILSTDWDSCGGPGPMTVSFSAHCRLGTEVPGVGLVLVRLDGPMDRQGRADQVTVQLHDVGVV